MKLTKYLNDHDMISSECGDSSHLNSECGDSKQPNSECHLSKHWKYSEHQNSKLLNSLCRISKQLLYLNVGTAIKLLNSECQRRPRKNIKRAGLACSFVVHSLRSQKTQIQKVSLPSGFKFFLFRRFLDRLNNCWHSQCVNK